LSSGGSEQFVPPGLPAGIYQLEVMDGWRHALSKIVVL
jgi:hypothetical protein